MAIQIRRVTAVDRKQMVAVLPRVGVFWFSPPERPVAAMNRAERPAAVQGAPGFGAAQRTLDGEDRSATWQQSTGSCAAGRICRPPVNTRPASPPPPRWLGCGFRAAIPSRAPSPIADSIAALVSRPRSARSASVNCAAWRWVHGTACRRNCPTPRSAHSNSQHPLLQLSGARQFVLFGGTLSRVFQRCLTRCRQSKNQGCKTSVMPHY